ncbi:MAG: hypothetical protein ACLS3Y_02525 [Collinsella sp.]
MSTPLRSRYHEFSKSLSALGMPSMVSRAASSIKVMLSGSSGNARDAFGAIGSVAIGSVVSAVQSSKAMLSEWLLQQPSGHVVAFNVFIMPSFCWLNPSV